MLRSSFSILVLSLLFAASSFAQDAMPTKEETVNYINKKLAELDGHKVSKGRPAERAIGFNLNQGGKIEMTFPHSHERDGALWIFDPKDIADVEMQKLPGSDMDKLLIRFVAKVAKGFRIERSGVVQNGGDPAVIDNSILVYTVRVPGYAEKLKKALLHLRDLAKAEDDLF